MADGLSFIVDEMESGRSEPTQVEDVKDESPIVETPIESPAETPYLGVGSGSWSDVEPIKVATDIPHSELDTANVPYDPNIHSPNRKTNKDGTWRKRPGKGNVVVSPVQPTVDSEKLKREACRRAAIQMVGQIIIMGTMIGGEEWKPLKNDEYGIDEFDTMVDAWSEFFYDKGIIKLPSWITLSIVMGSYAAIRCAMPKTQERIQAVTEWWKSRRAAKAEAKAKKTK